MFSPYVGYWYKVFQKVWYKKVMMMMGGETRKGRVFKKKSSCESVKSLFFTVSTVIYKCFFAVHIVVNYLSATAPQGMTTVVAAADIAKIAAAVVVALSFSFLCCCCCCCSTWIATVVAAAASVTVSVNVAAVVAVVIMYTSFI